MTRSPTRIVHARGIRRVFLSSSLILLCGSHPSLSILSPPPFEPIHPPYTCSARILLVISLFLIPFSLPIGGFLPSSESSLFVVVVAFCQFLFRTPFGMRSSRSILYEPFSHSSSLAVRLRAEHAKGITQSLVPHVARPLVYNQLQFAFAQRSSHPLDIRNSVDLVVSSFLIPSTCFARIKRHLFFLARRNPIVNCYHYHSRKPSFRLIHSYHPPNTPPTHLPPSLPSGVHASLRCPYLSNSPVTRAYMTFTRSF